MGLLLLQIAALAAHFLSSSSGAAWAFKVVVPALALALLPGGALCLTLLRDRARPATEWVVTAVGTSIVVVQAAILLALVLHLGPGIVVGGGAVLIAASLLFVAARGDDARPVVRMTWADALLWVGLAVLSAFLYDQGSPWSEGEDYLHLGVIRRLSRLDAPAIDNLYFVPGAIYTYPFPAIHYYMALVSWLGGADPIFVYHKMRFVWSPVAVACVSVFATHVFASRALGMTCGMAALAFTASGAFAMSPPLMWGQLAPVSHASDVAMGVVLPLALVFAAAYLTGGSANRRRYYYTGAMGLALTMSVVHIRELVQWLVYLLAFALFLSCSARWPTHRVRAWRLFAGGLAIAVVYVAWHRVAVGHVTVLVDSYRARLVDLAISASPLELLGHQLPLMAHFVNFYEKLFEGWNPVVLALMPVVVLAFGRRPLVWFVVASTFVYLLIIRFPLVALPYVYATYFEILYTPVRNIAFFIHVMAGAVVYVLAGRVGAWRRPWSAAGALGLAAASALVWLAPREFLVRHQDVLILPVLAALGLVLWRRGWSAGAAREPSPPRRASTFWIAGAGLAGVAIAVAVVLWHLTATPAHTVQVTWRADVGPTRRLLSELRYGLANPDRLDGPTVNYDLVDDSPRNIAALVRSASVSRTRELDTAAMRVSASAKTGTAKTWAGRALPLLGLPAGVQGLLLVLVALVAYCLHRVREGVVPAWPFAVPGHAWLSAGLVGWLSLASWTPDASPLVALSPAADLEQVLKTKPCVIRDWRKAAPFAPAGVEGSHAEVRCPPPADLMRWFTANMPQQAVLAVDVWNEVPASTFLPAQYVGWAGLEGAFVDTETLFGPYLRRYRRALERYGDQPVFNEAEPETERRAFLDEFGVTHILVDPPSYDAMARALATGFYERIYDADRWAVYRVARRSP